jgi:hypothetical protein
MFISNLDQQQKEPHPYTTAPDSCPQSKRFFRFVHKKPKIQSKRSKIHTLTKSKKVLKKWPEISQSWEDLAQIHHDVEVEA